MGRVEAAGEHVGVVEAAGGFEHRGGGDAGGLQGMEELVVVLGLGPVADVGVQLVLMLDAVRRGGVVVGGGPIGIAHDATEGGPVVVVVDGDRDPAVATVGAVAGGATRVGVAGSEAVDGAVADDVLHVAIEGVVHEGLSQQGRSGLGLRDLDELPPACATSVSQCGHDGEGAVRPRHVVAGEDRGGVRGVEVAVAPQEAVSHHALQVHPQRARLAVRPGEAVAGGANHDDVVLPGAQGLVVEAELLDRADGVVLEEDVGLLHQAADEVDASGAGHVDGGAVLVAVELDEGGAVVPGTGARHVARPAAGPGGRALHHGLGWSSDAAPRHWLPDVHVLDLDHLRAEVGEEQGGEGAGPDDREVDDADAFEGEPGAHGCTSIAPWAAKASI